MRIALPLLLGALGISVLAGCSSTPVKLDPVGPGPGNTGSAAPVGGSTAAAGMGWLKVITATQVRQIGNETYYYPHTSYRIKTESGQFWKYVANHVDDMDQSPTLVRIPAGHYLVSAQSESYGPVTVPVVIQPDQLTAVHLESRWKPSPDIVGTNLLVRLPNGDLVGWRSTLKHSSE